MYYSKGLVRTIFYVGLIGSLLSILPFIGKSLLDDLNLDGESVSNIGDLLFSIAESVLLYLIASKLTSLSIKKPSNGLLKTFVVLNIIVPIVSLIDSLEEFTVIALICMLIVGIITFIGFLNNKTTKSIGIWWFIAIVVQIFVLFIFSSADITSKGMLKLITLVYVGASITFLSACGKYLIGKEF